MECKWLFFILFCWWRSGFPRCFVVYSQFFRSSGRDVSGGEMLRRGLTAGPREESQGVLRGQAQEHWVLPSVSSQGKDLEWNCPRVRVMAALRAEIPLLFVLLFIPSPRHTVLMSSRAPHWSCWPVGRLSLAWGHLALVEGGHCAINEVS